MSVFDPARAGRRASDDRCARTPRAGGSPRAPARVASPAVKAITLGVVAATLAAGAPALAQEPPPSAPVTGRVIADGSWDGKLQPRRGGLPANWLGLQVKRRGRSICFDLRCARRSLRLVGSPVRDGARAARFEVRDGDNPFGDAERAEVQGPRTGRNKSMRWYTWSIFLPTGFRTAGANDARFMLLTQWAVERGSAPIGLYVVRGQLTIQVNEQANPRRFLAVHRPWGTPIAPLRGRWVDFAMFVKWRTGRAGEIQLWVDGVQQAMNWPLGTGTAAAHGGVGATSFTGRTLVPRGGATFVRQGIARSTRLRGRTVVIHDAMRVYATTTAPPPPPPPVPAEPAPPTP